jgi:eukaryotic-like serine/threonine-protein kinase
MDDLTDRSQFRIGDLLIVPARSVVVRDGQEIHLQPRMMAVLTLLAEEAGKVVSPEGLLLAIWRTLIYGDNPVHKAISDLRKSIGDAPHKPRYIETMPRLVYRLIAPVSFPETRPRI